MMTTCFIVARLISNIFSISLAECPINASAVRVFCSSFFLMLLPPTSLPAFQIIALFLSASFAKGCYRFLTIKQNIRAKIPLDFMDNIIGYFIQYSLEKYFL